MDHPSDPTTETPTTAAQPASSDTGCLIMAAAFAATPLLVLFGALGELLQVSILIAALVIGIPATWRRIKAGTNPTTTVLLIVGAVVLYALIHAFVQAVMSSA